MKQDNLSFLIEGRDITLIKYCILFLTTFYCKDQLSLKPETGMDPGPRSPNNKFIESGRKCQSESRIKILVYNVKRKELHALRYKKYHQTCPSTGTKSNEFFFFTVVFLQPLLSFSLSFLFFPPFFSLFLRIIYYGFYTIPSIHVWVRCWESFFSVFLTSS